MSKKSPPFFVGYLKVPAELKKFLLVAAALFFLAFAGSAIVIGATQDDPGKAGFRFDYGRQTQDEEAEGAWAGYGRYSYGAGAAASAGTYAEGAWAGYGRYSYGGGAAAAGTYACMYEYIHVRVRVIRSHP